MLSIIPLMSLAATPHNMVESFRGATWGAHAIPEEQMARRRELELLEDRHNLAQIALTNPGATSRELSVLYEKEYGVVIPPRTVRYDLQQLKKQWVAETRDNMELVRARELARVDALEQQAWLAWRASLQPFNKIVVERLRHAINDAARAKLAGELAKELAEDNDYVNAEVIEAIVRDALAESIDQGEDAETFVNKVTETTEARIGDPRFLSQIHEIQKERRKILGAYMPELHQLDIRKVELKGYSGGWDPGDWLDNKDVIDGEVEEPEALSPGEEEGKI
jgi:hypothetical protein